MRLVPGPAHEPPGIAAVGEDALDEGEAGARGLQHAPGPVAVPHVAGMDLDLEQASVGVGQDVPLAPVDLLGPVETLESPF
jgi:hypothetical protein